jgi:hypothetical protein
MTRSATVRQRRWAITIALVVLGIPAIALAQQQVLGGKFRAGDEVVVPAGETVSGDLFASGGTVRIDGSVEGDLVASDPTARGDGSRLGRPRPDPGFVPHARSRR